MSQFFTSGCQSIGASASASAPPMNILEPCGGHFCKQCGFYIDWFSGTAFILAPDPCMEDCQRGSVCEALVLVIHMWHPLWLHAPLMSSEPTWWAWQLLPSTDHVLCLRIVGTCQTVGTSTSHRQRWKLCVHESPHIALHTDTPSHPAVAGKTHEVSCHQQNLSRSRSQLLNLWLNFSLWVIFLFSNYMSFAWNLGFCCGPHFCSWVSEMVQFWKWQCQNLRATGW